MPRRLATCEGRLKRTPAYIRAFQLFSASFPLRQMAADVDDSQLVDILLTLSSEDVISWSSTPMCSAPLSKMSPLSTSQLRSSCIWTMREVSSLAPLERPVRRPLRLRWSRKMIRLPLRWVIRPRGLPLRPHLGGFCSACACSAALLALLRGHW